MIFKLILVLALPAIALTPSAFAQRVDAALHTNNATYFFLGNQYVRLKGTTVDQGYPRPITEWTYFPAYFHNDIDAAFFDPVEKRSYFLKGTQYLRVNGTTAEKTGNLTDKWSGLPSNFRRDIDAAIFRKGFLYLFKSGKYVRIRGKNVDQNYPRSLPGGWDLDSDFINGIDAAFHSPRNGKNYMFRGKHYVRLTDLKLDKDYPKGINNWKGLPIITSGPTAKVIETDLGVRVTRVKSPKSIWQNRPVETTCDYSVSIAGTRNDSVAPFIKSADIRVVLTARRINSSGNNPVSNPNIKASYDGLNEFANVRIIPKNGRLPFTVKKGKLKGSFLPKFTGRYKIECRITSNNNLVQQSDRSNDVSTDETAYIYGIAPSRPQDIPIPRIIRPFRKILVVTPLTQKINVQAQILPRELTPVWRFPETQSIVFEEHWNLRLLRLREGGRYESVAAYSRKLKNQTGSKRVFEFQIPREATRKLVSGAYRLDVWLSQSGTPNGTISGPKAKFEFKVERRKLDARPNIDPKRNPDN